MSNNNNIDLGNQVVKYASILRGVKTSMCFYRDRDVRSLDIFDERAHPLTVRKVAKLEDFLICYLYIVA